MPGPEESAHVFECEGAQLLGILHRPESPARRGVVILVGGPQYRVGSHRQFLLLARLLAGRGIPVFRFDYRGMGDSSGKPVSFLDCGPDLRNAIDVFTEKVPELREVVIWGLCDAASAAAIYAPDDGRVKGLVLLNPWARSEQSQAATHLRHYYLKRLVAADFWRRLLRGKGSLRKSATSLLADIRSALQRGENGAGTRQAEEEETDFRLRMLRGLQRFAGKVLIVISERDLTASEFMDMTRASTEWETLMHADDITLITAPGADHTFSSRKHREVVERSTEEWLRSW